MIRPVLTTLAIALLSLSACNSQGGGSGGNATAAASGVQGKAPPAGTSWGQQIAQTPDGGFRMGNPDAPIKLIEFGSYTCPHCAEFSETSHEPLERDHVNSGKVSFEYRNFIRDPLDMAVALVARCGGPEAFFPLNSQFFQNQAAMIEKIQAAPNGAYQAAMALPPEQRMVKLAELAGLIEFAKARGLPEAKARQCLADPKAAEALAEGVQKATQQYDISGTPTLIMNGTKMQNVATWPQLLEGLKAAGA